MLRCTLWHEPEGFQFYIRDPAVHPLFSLDAANDRWSKGFLSQEGCISVRTLSEYTEVPITVEYDASSLGLEDSNSDGWDHIVECSIETKSKKIIFEGCTDADPFGVLEIPSGNYRVRIHFGGQLTGQMDGSTGDFYLVQIWPGTDTAIRYIKGDELWPRSEQPWETERKKGA